MSRGWRAVLPWQWEACEDIQQVQRGSGGNYVCDVRTVMCAHREQRELQAEGGGVAAAAEKKRRQSLHNNQQ